MSIDEILKLVDLVAALEEGRFRYKNDEHCKIAIIFLVLKETRPYTLNMFYKVRSRNRLIFCLKELMKKLNITTKVWSKKIILEWFRKNGYINKKELYKISNNWVRKHGNEIKNFFATVNKLEKMKKLKKREWKEFNILKEKC